jgi:post-segregation antitoxin (ccd killing protein)
MVDHVLYVSAGGRAVPQLHLYVPADVAAELRARARARGTSVSKLLAEIVTRDARRAWPEGWLDRVAGAWRDPWPVVDDPPPDERRSL